jgi:hypothetical protein
MAMSPSATAAAAAASAAAAAAAAAGGKTDTEAEDDPQGERPRCPRFVGEGNKVIVCAARKPVRVSKSRQGDAWAYRPSQSSFKASIDFMSETNRVHWVGWPGAVVDPGTQDAVRKRLEAEHSCSPIFLDREQVIYTSCRFLSFSVRVCSANNNHPFFNAAWF